MITEDMKLTAWNNYIRCYSPVCDKALLGEFYVQCADALEIEK